MVAPFRTRIQLRWADIDANFHLRHSVFYDLCAQQRIVALQSVGLTMDVMQQHHFGPIIFREECIFRREIKLTDDLFLELAVRHLSRDRRKWSFAHTFIKADGTDCATSNCEGAWMDTGSRKLTAPPAHLGDNLELLPRAPDFTWI